MLAAFCPATPPPMREERVVSLSRYDEVKQLDQALRAWAKVAPEFPDWRFELYGDGPLRPRLEGRPGVTVTGYVPHDAVPGYLAAADVLCQPSLVEPFGQAALEALACSRSVVATTLIWG